MRELLEQYTVYGYILLYMYLFMIGSMAGFWIEVLYRRYVSVKRWVNPGFMKGPWIPLYGFGVILMSGIITIINSAFYNNGIILYNPSDLYGLGEASGPCGYDLIPILIMGISMTLLELIAGLIFVKGFKVRLWDYTNDKGNFMGIICPKFSIIWILVSVLFYYFLSPWIYNLAAFNAEDILNPALEGGMPKIWIIYALGLIYGAFLLDFFTSLGLFNKVSGAARKLGKVFHYDRITANLNLFRKEASNQFKAMMPDALRKNLDTYMNKDPKKTFKYKIKTFLLIDPDKEETGNFDEFGRPISDDNFTNKDENNVKNHK